MSKTRTYKPLDKLIDETGLKKKVIVDRLGVDYATFYRWRVKPSSITAIELGELSEAAGIDFMLLYKVVKKFKNERDKLDSVVKEKQLA